MLRKLGGTMITIPTADFPGMNPDNFSNGYGLKVTFGIDYRHQADCLDSIPKKLEEKIGEELPKVVNPEWICGFSVELAEAGANSLDYGVFVSLAAQAAPQRPAIPRAIQRICIAACNENGWGIPFPQMVVHQGEGGATAFAK
jgi:small-conductance mechanosensitive channel